MPGHSRRAPHPVQPAGASSHAQPGGVSLHPQKESLRDRRVGSDLKLGCSVVSGLVFQALHLFCEHSGPLSVTSSLD